MTEKSKGVRLEEALEGLRKHLGDMEVIAHELKVWRDSMEGTKSENTARYESISEAADALYCATERISAGIEDVNQVEWERYIRTLTWWQQTEGDG